LSKDRSCRASWPARVAKQTLCWDRPDTFLLISKAPTDQMGLTCWVECPVHGKGRSRILCYTACWGFCAFSSWKQNCWAEAMSPIPSSFLQLQSIIISFWFYQTYY